MWPQGQTPHLLSPLIPVWMTLYWFWNLKNIINFVPPWTYPLNVGFFCLTFLHYLVLTDHLLQVQSPAVLSWMPPFWAQMLPWNHNLILTRPERAELPGTRALNEAICTDSVNIILSPADKSSITSQYTLYSGPYLLWVNHTHSTWPSKKLYTCWEPKAETASV